MPRWPDDSPPIDGLKAAVEKRLLPRPATSAPALDRAVGNLTKLYPKDMADTTVVDLPWDDPIAGSMTVGQTYIQHGSPQEIGINPVWPRAFPQDAVEGTLAHELEHARKNRQYATFPDLVRRMDMERKLPYRERPSEMDGRNATTRYYADTAKPQPAFIQTTDFDAMTALSRVMGPRGQR